MSGEASPVPRRALCRRASCNHQNKSAWSRKLPPNSRRSSRLSVTSFRRRVNASRTVMSNLFSDFLRACSSLYGSYICSVETRVQESRQGCGSACRTLPAPFSFDRCGFASRRQKPLKFREGRTLASGGSRCCKGAWPTLSRTMPATLVARTVCGRFSTGHSMPQTGLILFVAGGPDAFYGHRGGKRGEGGEEEGGKGERTGGCALQCRG
jgi:hypothetical protein